MKFLITESKLENVIFKYLDNQDFVKIDDGKRIWLIKSIEEDYSTIFYSRVTNYCSVRKSFVVNLRTFFSIDTKNAFEIISKWIEKTLDVKVENIDYGIVRHKPY